MLIVSGCPFIVEQSDERSGEIYANGRHQAILKIEIGMVDAEGAPLIEGNYPSIDTVREAVNLINFHGKERLGAGSSVGWTDMAEMSVFNTPLASTQFAAVKPIEAADEISASTAYLNYYVVCGSTAENMNITIWLEIEILDAMILYKSVFSAAHSGRSMKASWCHL